MSGFPWCLTAKDGSILERFATDEDAREASFDPAYEDAEIAYVAEPDIDDGVRYPIDADDEPMDMSGSTRGAER